MKHRTYSNIGPTCPYCNHTITPDEASYYDPPGYDIDCGECSAPFTVEVNISVSWIGKERKEPEPLYIVAFNAVWKTIGNDWNYTSRHSPRPLWMAERLQQTLEYESGFIAWIERAP